MTLTHGGLFEGYGGTTMAARRVLGTLDTRWVSDIKPASIALLRHRHPDVPNLGDMTEIDYSRVEPVDVLTVSWPGQPHSAAGKRLGKADPRALWPHVARAVAQARPAVFFGELRRVVRTFADLGYVGAWRCVRASDIGAPHRRDRCFVVAVDPVAYSVGIELRDESRRGGGASGAGTGVSGHDGAPRATGLTLLPTPRAGDAIRGSGDAHAASDGPKGGPGMRGSSYDLSMPSAAVLMEGSRWGIYGAAIERWEQMFGRRAPEPTQASSHNGKPQLAPPFVEWMMGLPPGWVCDVPDLAFRPAGRRNAALSLLGDGVVPAQGAMAFGFLLDHLFGRLRIASRAAI